ncbi:MAG: DUF2231 domain-containing protein [Candidatus Acidiferrales bacterium]|jgi:uncharacterized membrane protein
MHPFDLRQMLEEKHAQHVVLIHFPIALFIAGVGMDFVAQWTKRTALEFAAYVNLLLAAVMALPAVATGLVAWQWALEGHRIKGILFLHIVFALASAAVIWIVWWIHFRARRGDGARLPSWRLVLEFMGVTLLAITGHLGGFLSGVNS